MRLTDRQTDRRVSTYIGRTCTGGRRGNADRPETAHSSVVRWSHHRRRHSANQSALYTQ